MRLMIAVGLVVVLVGACLSLVASRIQRSGEPLGRMLSRAVGRGMLLRPLYWLVLWGTGSLNGGIALSRVYGNYYVQREFLPLAWGSRNVHVRRGQKLVIAYDVMVERGQLNLRVFPSSQ